MEPVQAEVDPLNCRSGFCEMLAESFAQDTISPKANGGGEGS